MDERNYSTTEYRCDYDGCDEVLIVWLTDGESTDRIIVADGPFYDRANDRDYVTGHYCGHNHIADNLPMEIT